MLWCTVIKKDTSLHLRFLATGDTVVTYRAMEVGCDGSSRRQLKELASSTSQSVSLLPVPGLRKSIPVPPGICPIKAPAQQDAVEVFPGLLLKQATVLSGLGF